MAYIEWNISQTLSGRWYRNCCQSYISLRLKRGNWSLFWALLVLVSTVLILGGMATMMRVETFWIDRQNIADYTSPQLTDCRQWWASSSASCAQPDGQGMLNWPLKSSRCQDPVALTAVGLEKRLNNFPAQLSGGAAWVLIVGLWLRIPRFLPAMSRQWALTTILSAKVLQIYRHVPKSSVKRHEKRTKTRCA